MKKIHWSLIPFIWVWKAIKFIGKNIWKAIQFVYRYFFKLLKMLWKKRYMILSVITSLFLLVAPYIIINYLFSKKLLTHNDWGNIVGGCLGYYGTIILGIVAVWQTQKALKQNSDTFKADKYSSIKIKKDCSFQVIENSEQVYENIYKYPINQYFVSLKNDFTYDKQQIFLKLKLTYNFENYPINKIRLNNTMFNYETNLFIDNNIKTDLCENPIDECGQLEIVFRLSKSELKTFEDKFNDGVFILNLSFDILSSADVKITENIEVNMSSPDFGQHICFDEREQDWLVASTSYSFKKEKENDKRFKSSSRKANK